MNKKINPKPLPISMIEKYAIDMIAKIFPEVEKPENGFELDSLGTAILLSGLDRSTEPFLEEENLDKNSNIKDLKKESDLYFAPEAGPVDHDGNYPYSNYFIVSGFVERKGYLICTAEKDCPKMEDHNDNSFYASMLVQFFHGGKTREECQKIVEVLESRNLQESFGRLFHSAFALDTQMIPNAFDVMLDQAKKIELKDKDLENIINVLKNGVKELSKELGKARI